MLMLMSIQPLEERTGNGLWVTQGIPKVECTFMCSLKAIEPIFSGFFMVLGSLDPSIDIVLRTFRELRPQYAQAFACLIYLNLES